MEPTLTWLDLTAEDQKRMRRVLALLHEPQTRDEMGLARLRDTFSDALFPGTTTIQTRLRYVLFIPWIYRHLEARPPAPDRLSSRARQSELALIGSLASTGEKGVIGIRARGSLKRLPSSVYWWPLVRWGLFRPGRSQGWYHARFHALTGRRKRVERSDDPGVIWSREPTWHPSLPRAPERFPEGASFELTRAEAEFLQGRITESCAGTLLGWLAQEGAGASAGSFWDNPSVEGASANVRDCVELARRFSLHVEGMALLYNLLLAERYAERVASAGEDPGRKRSRERYRKRLEAWEARESAEQPFDPVTLWVFTADQRTRIPSPQRRFVERWSRRLDEIGARGVADDGALRHLVADREIQLKRNRARLANTTRLLEWGGNAGVGRMDFRWGTVRRLVEDLHAGLRPGLRTATAPGSVRS